MALHSVSLTPRRIVLLAVALVLAAAACYELMPGQRLKAKHDDLVEWARSGAPSDFAEKFAAPDYTDQWGHTPQAVAEGLRVARFVHPRLEIDAGTPAFDRTGRDATVTQEITVRPGDGETFQHKGTFRWRRIDFRPWSWRLVSVHAPGLELP